MTIRILSNRTIQTYATLFTSALFATYVHANSIDFLEYC